MPKPPEAVRPRMQGYGVPEAPEGMLPWEWALDRLTRSHNYWLTTVKRNSAPHTMLVWGVWLDGAWYCSTSATSQKARNLAANSHCVVCNEDAAEAVIVEGTAHQVPDSDIPAQAFTDYKNKYGWELDPKRGPVWQVRPHTVFAMPEKQFPHAVTKWVFES